MEAVIFCGLQAAGKSAFYLERFVDTHLRLSMDMLRTRHREGLLLRTFLEAKQPFVVDNTNPTAEERARYIVPARAARFRVVGYLFDITLEEALRRNALRTGKQRIPEKGLRATLRKLERPTLEEGFDVLYRVEAYEGRFEVALYEPPTASVDDEVQ